MRGKTTITIDPVGPVLFESSSRARRIGISVRPFKGVRVGVPYGVPLEVARDFAAANTGWIQKQILHADKIELKAQSAEAVQLSLFGGMEEKASKEEILTRLAVLSEQHGLAYNKAQRGISASTCT